MQIATLSEAEASRNRGGPIYVPPMNPNHVNSDTNSADSRGVSMGFHCAEWCSMVTIGQPLVPLGRMGEKLREKLTKTMRKSNLK